MTSLKPACPVGLASSCAIHSNSTHYVNYCQYFRGAGRLPKCINSYSYLFLPGSLLSLADPIYIGIKDRY